MKNLNSTFKCACNGTYGTHRLFFCVCTDCYQNIKKGCDVSKMNNKWLKFCVLQSSVEILTFNGSMRFFSFKDIVNHSCIFWCYGESLIKKNDLYENLDIFGFSRNLLPMLYNSRTFYLQLVLLLLVWQISRLPLRILLWERIIVAFVELVCTIPLRN